MYEVQEWVRMGVIDLTKLATSKVIATTAQGMLYVIQPTDKAGRYLVEAAFEGLSAPRIARIDDPIVCEGKQLLLQFADSTLTTGEFVSAAVQGTDWEYAVF